MNSYNGNGNLVHRVMKNIFAMKLGEFCCTNVLLISNEPDFYNG